MLSRVGVKGYDDDDDEDGQQALSFTTTSAALLSAHIIKYDIYQYFLLLFSVKLHNSLFACISPSARAQHQLEACLMLC